MLLDNRKAQNEVRIEYKFETTARHKSWSW